MKSTLTEKQWNSFVNNYCTDEEMKKISYKELMDNTNNGQLDLSDLSAGSNEKVSDVSADCGLAIGFVIADVVALATGALSIRASVSEESAQTIAGIVGPDIPDILKYVDTIAAEGSSDEEIAKAVFGIMKVTLKSPYDIVKAVFASLPWYKKALAIAQGVATIVAAVATDGIAFIAEVVVELASFGFLVTDSVHAVSACSTS
jgi:hypothetical protein